MRKPWSSDRIAEVRGTIAEWVAAGDLLVGIGDHALAGARVLLPDVKTGLILDRDDNRLELPPGGIVDAGRDMTTAVFVGAVKAATDETMPRAVGVRAVHDRHDPAIVVQRLYFANQAALHATRLREAQGQYGAVCRLPASLFTEYDDRAWTHQTEFQVPILGAVEVSTDVLPFDPYQLPPPETHPALVMAFQRYPT